MNKAINGFFPPALGTIETRSYVPKEMVQEVDMTPKTPPQAPITTNTKNNERLIPTGSLLADKKFSIGLWLYIQNLSKYNHIDDNRYIKKDLLNSTMLMPACKLIKEGEGKKFNITPASRNTITKYINHLKDTGYIVGEVDGSRVFDGYTGTYYEVKNKDAFDKYVLLGNDFLEILLENLSQEAIKVYLIYYSYNCKKSEGICYLNQSEILNRIGLCANTRNLTKLRYINKQLESLGLIFTEKQYIKQFGVVVKTKISTKAPFYWNTKIYKNRKKPNN